MARRILLADDSVTAQNMGRRILTDAGYEVVTVNNGSAALKKIAENKPDLIVLDVYMPGYGGLEVCQRVKESPETRQIPVLLTVGKLEPFKGEEARRVGADAFIIKPFEATELLTVLTKLEDKIVALPHPGKSGWFAKASVHLSDTGDRFGDKETGWKNRLTIPNPNAKPAVEEEGPEAVTVKPRDNEVAKPVEPAQEFERPIPVGLPGDITPEEIAAITAAAATFGGKAELPSEISEVAAQAPAVSQDVVLSQAAVAESSGDAIAEALASVPEKGQDVQVAAPAEVISEAVASAAGDKAEGHQTEVEPARVQPTEVQTEGRAGGADLPAVETNPDTNTGSDIPAVEPAQPAVGDAEVMAAIATLAPTNGHALGSNHTEPSNRTPYQVSGSVIGGSAVSAEILSGPRWVAQSVAVAVEESKLALDQEMEQATASRSLATAAAASASAVAVVESAIVAEASVVEPIAIESNAIESGSVNTSTVQENALAAVPEQSAYAAAAGAEHTTPIEAVSATAAVPESDASAPVDSALPREAELAAAWRNWKQIRESLAGSPPAGSQPPAAGAEAPAEPDSKQAEAATPEQAESADAAPEPVETEGVADEAPEESTAIASIVDSMLAELRPKLVEEIAKKLNSEKKEKEKKKKK